MANVRETSTTDFEATVNETVKPFRLGQTVSAPELIQDMQDYCNQGSSKDIILKRLTDNYNMLSVESNPTNIAIICSKIAIDNYLLSKMVSTISIQK